MNNENITSQLIASLYKKEEEDENVFELTDVSGIHILRKYSAGTVPEKNNRRMFITLSLKENSLINGGINMVNVPDDIGNGYPIVDGAQEGIKNLFYQKYANFFFGDNEGAVFVSGTKKIIFRKKEYSINEFIHLLVKNHSSDMFRASRVLIFLKTKFILSPLFWLADSSYEKDKMDFLLQGKTLSGTWQGPKIREVADPFFRYFKIYNNTLFFVVLLILPLLFWLSVYLDTEYFAITNPFFLFIAFLLFFLLEKTDDLLFRELGKKEGYVYRIAKSTLNMKGKIIL